MLEFIFVPVIVGICVAGVYGLFELFARRRERIMIIEKLSEKLDIATFNGKLSLPSFAPRLSFSALKIGCLLIGVGLGLLVGFFFNFMIWSYGNYTHFTIADSHYLRHGIETLPEIAYGASVLLFGGIGLLVSFILENRMVKKD